jgi:UDPglucose 6-dehydrogenase
MPLNVAWGGIFASPRRRLDGNMGFRRVMPTSVSVIGMGKLGAPMAAAMAARGIRAIGVDSDAAKVDAIERCLPPVFEPRLAEILILGQGRLTATQSVEDAVRDSDITFIVVATPAETDGTFSLRHVLPVCEAIGRALASKRDFHVVVVTSTVMPGQTGGAIRQTLEDASQKRAGIDFGLCYSPEFVALGSVIHDFLNPDLLVIGESDERSGALLESLYCGVCENRPTVARMNFVNAEIAKLSVNTYVTTKINFANMLARLCEKVPGASVDVVTGAIGLDSRIGGKYLKGAISYGGPCFPRDNVALIALADRLGAPADLPRATHQFNHAQIQSLADTVEQNLGPSEAAGILGLTYKPNTDVTEEAAGLLLAGELARRKVRTFAFDPEGHVHAAKTLGSSVDLTASAEACIGQCGVVVLATPWPAFLAIPADRWARVDSPRIVIDCWRALKHLQSAQGIRYLGLGNGTILEESVVRETTQ